MRYRESITSSCATANRRIDYYQRASAYYTHLFYRNGVDRCISDVVSPHYVRDSARGKVFNNPCDKIHVTYSDYNTGYGHQYDLTPSIGQGYRDVSDSLLNWARPPGDALHDLSTWIFYDSVDKDKMAKEALTMALANVKRPDANSLVLLGEASETLRFLRRPLQGIFDLTRTLIYKRSRTKVMKSLANLHLQWSFGVRPLMSEAEGILKALGGRSIDRATSRGYVSDVRTRSTQAALYTGTILQSVDYLTEEKEEITFRPGILYSLEEMATTDRLGLSVRELPGAAWELIPFSFVADWVGNIGDCISAIVTLLDTKLEACWVTEHSTRTTTESVLPETIVNATNWSCITPCSDTRTCVYKTYTRSVVRPSHAYPRLAFRSSLGRVNVLASLSLLLQRLK